MAYRKLIYFVLIECFLFFCFGMLAAAIGENFWNVRALHFIIFQDGLFIIFSILPAMGQIFMAERIKIFNFHGAVIALHTVNGIVLVITGKDKVDQQFFVSVAGLVFIGCIFSLGVAIMLGIAYFSGDFEAIFDEQFLNIDGAGNPRVRRLDDDFLEEFENIKTIFYKKYMCLKDTSCPICLGEYQEEDILKILPGGYHAFHKEGIRHWFKNQLKCPFGRIEITKEQIEREKDLSEDEVLRKLKHSDSFASIDFKSRPKEKEVRVKEVVEEEKSNKKHRGRNLTLFRRGIPKSRKVPRKGKGKRSEKGQASNGFIGQSSLNESNGLNNHRTLKVGNDILGHRESLQPPKIGLRMPTPDKLDKFEDSDFEDVEFEKEMIEQELASERIEHNLDYFKLEDEKVI